MKKAKTTLAWGLKNEDGTIQYYASELMTVKSYCGDLEIIPVEIREVKPRKKKRVIMWNGLH